MRSLIMLFCLVSMASADTINKRIYQISAASLSSLQNKQIGVNTTADATLGFKMWGGKDADGNVTNWLAKDKAARVQSLKTDSLFSTLTTANYVNKATTNGRIINSQIFDNGVAVGINTATPDASLKLDIVGGMRATKGIFNAASGVAFRVQYNGVDAIKNEDWITTMTGGDPDGPVLILNQGHLDVNGGSIKVGNGTREIDYDNNSAIVVGNDGAIDFTSDSINHGLTSILPSNTHGRITNTNQSMQHLAGGLKLIGIGQDGDDDNTPGIHLYGINKESGYRYPPIYLDGAIDIGSNVGPVGSADKLFAIANNGTTKFSVLGDGSIYSNALSGNYLTKANTLGVITESRITDSANIIQISQLNGSAILRTNYNNTVLLDITASSDSVAYIGTVSNHPTAFQTNNNERARITKTGNFLIGNTTGTEKLDVTGNIKASGKITGDTLVVLKNIVFPTRYDDMDPFTLSAAKSVGATGFPPLVSTGNGFSQYQIGIGDSAQGIIEHGHKFIEGDTDHIHVHYLTAVKDAGSAYVNWSIHYLARNVNDTITYTGTVTKQDTIPANTPALTHRMFEIAEISMPNIKIGSMRTICIKRIAASPATNPSISPYILQVGIHRKVNSIGSRTETTK